MAVMVTTGQLAWGQQGEYSARQDRQVIRALSGGRAGVAVAAEITPGTGLAFPVAPGWLAIADCGDGTLAVVGSDLPGEVTAEPGNGTDRDDLVWVDVWADQARWSLSVIRADATEGRAGVALATVHVPGWAAEAAHMTVTPHQPPAPPGGGGEPATGLVVVDGMNRNITALQNEGYRSPLSPAWPLAAPGVLDLPLNGFTYVVFRLTTRGRAQPFADRAVGGTVLRLHVEFTPPGDAPILVGPVDVDLAAFYANRPETPPGPPPLEWEASAVVVGAGMNYDGYDPGTTGATYLLVETTWRAGRYRDVAGNPAAPGSEAASAGGAFMYPAVPLWTVGEPVTMQLVANWESTYGAVPSTASAWGSTMAINWNKIDATRRAPMPAELAEMLGRRP